VISSKDVWLERCVAGLCSVHVSTPCVKKTVQIAFAIPLSNFHQLW